MIIAWLTIMKTVVSETMLNTVFLQIALTSRRTGTLQAATRLPLCLLLKTAQLDNAEVACTILVGQHRHLHFRLVWLVRHDIEKIRFSLLQLQSTRYLFHVLTHQEG